MRGEFLNYELRVQSYEFRVMSVSFFIEYEYVNKYGSQTLKI